jgi:AraC-like DNA-binding protein
VTTPRGAATSVATAGDPEAAIAAFERLHGVTVAVHDVAGVFVHRLAPGRLRHRHPACVAAKSLGHEADCVAFDVHAMRRDLPLRPDGVVKVCHAGVVELAVPRRGPGGHLAFVVFAGLWRDEGSGAELRQASAWRGTAGGLPAFDRGRGFDLLEALRQLAARLGECAGRDSGAAPRTGPGSRAGGGSQAAAVAQAVAERTGFAPRAEAIRAFIARWHTQAVGLADLAAELGLSESRTSHEVAACCGMGFARLLAEARLATAAWLLRHSGLPVVEVALASGFGDVSHFHACFRRRFATTPRRYRAAAVAV